MSYCLFRDEISSLDLELKRSCSIPNGLDESVRFLPNARTEIRRTSSLHDISRFYRYFHLIQTNSGMLITWRHYLEILQEHLRSFETLTILNKAMLSKLSDISLEKSYYFTPEGECPFPSQDTISLQTTKQTTADYTRKSNLSDEDSSIVSGNSSIVSRRSQILKKICSEMKKLTQNINRFVEIMSRFPEKCTECGVPMNAQKYKKDCGGIIESIGDAAGFSEHQIKDQKKRSSTSFLSISSVFSMRSSRGEGEFTTKLQTGKCSARKKGSLKHMANLCSKYVRRR
ncbi:uncharacterized protein TNCT_246971 [Trichonephila clavata]|uniref:Uncharacterized protein n=1 Tax=Trichonephila clavata TaxID=2740835 RepID=A0A8X6LVA6_TRICU|nr:uncharacterized protein TNCT_246971 [Trichonephila clavata]